jgi:hypothetical protein
MRLQKLIITFSLTIMAFPAGAMTRDQARAILGVEPGAPLQQIRQKYRNLALQWHPDKNPDKVGEATEKFKQINEAYTILASDAPGGASVPPSGGGSGAAAAAAEEVPPGSAAGASAAEFSRNEQVRDLNGLDEEFDALRKSEDRDGYSRQDHIRAMYALYSKFENLKLRIEASAQGDPEYRRLQAEIVSIDLQVRLIEAAVKVKTDAAWQRLTGWEKAKYYAWRLNPLAGYIYSSDPRFPGGETPVQVVEMEAQIADLQGRQAKAQAILDSIKEIGGKCVHQMGIVRTGMVNRYRLTGFTHNGTRRVDRALDEIYRYIMDQGDERGGVLVRFNQMILNSAKPEEKVDILKLRELLRAYLDQGPDGAYRYLADLVTVSDRLKAFVYGAGRNPLNHAVATDLQQNLQAYKNEDQAFEACAKF